MNTPAAYPKRIRRVTFSTAFVMLILVVAALAVPLASVDSRSVAVKSPTAEQDSTRRTLTPVRSWFSTPATMAGETIEVFAADCSTPKAAFNLGETVCAKTNGVDLITTPGNYYMNWVDSSVNQTNGGTITQNPQYFLFVPPTTDTGWKATIGSLVPADSSIIGTPPIFSVSNGPAISTYAADCTTPKIAFTVGETVCAKATGIGATSNRRFAWIDADGITREFTPITADPATDDYAVLLTETSVGTWKANVVSSRGSAVVGTPFTVAALTPSVDLSIAKGLSSELKSGEDATFTIAVFNRGPNDAQNVVITDVTPANATFVSATQTGGSGFSCTGTTTVTCTAALMIPGERAVIEFVYTPGAAGQTVTNTATVDSDTPEVVSGQDTDGDTIDDASEDNSATAGPHTIAQGNGGGTCALNCPDDVQTPANTTDGGGNSGAIVHFVPPSPDEDCGTITYDHCNDCFFPEGTTTVTGTAAATGDTCTFTVTVIAAGSHPTINCPGNKSGTADGSCSATFALGTASASGQNVTVVGYRSDGKPVYTCDAFGNCTRNSSDAPFNVGTTTVTWYAYAHDVPGPYTGPVDGEGNPINESDTEEAHRTGSATCTQTVFVEDVTPPVIGATNQTIAADASCQAVVPDYISTVSDNCACASSDTSEVCDDRSDFIYTQNPAPGTVVGLGQHQVTITANDRSSNNNGAGNETTKQITLTVADQTPPAIDCPDNISTTTDPGSCSAVVNPGTATATDNCDSSPTITASRSDSQPLNAPYPKGTTTITWRATDDAGNYSECTQTITVADDEAPVINFNGQTPSLWPPNHSYHSFTVSNFVTSVGDNCGSIPVSSVYITKITSDETENGNGDGNTMNDILIGADCKSFQLRSERNGGGDGRVYTIHFEVQDSSGNTSTGTRTVVVRKSPPHAPVDSGVNYTVNSSCP